MTKKGNYYLVTSILMCCICLSILNISKIIQNGQNQITSASWSKVYESADALINDADVIIKGELIEEVPELRNDMVFTYERVKATEVYKGNVSVGDILDILQTGGNYGSISTPSIDEAPLFSEISSVTAIDSTEFLLCLKQTEYDELYGSYYLICGGFQGAGIITEQAGNESIATLVDVENVIFDEYSLMEIEEATSNVAVEQEID